MIQDDVVEIESLSMPAACPAARLSTGSRPGTMWRREV